VEWRSEDGKGDFGPEEAHGDGIDPDAADANGDVDDAGEQTDGHADGAGIDVDGGGAPDADTSDLDGGNGGDADAVDGDGWSGGDADAVDGDGGNGGDADAVDGDGWSGGDADAVDGDGWSWGDADAVDGDGQVGPDLGGDKGSEVGETQGSEVEDGGPQDALYPLDVDGAGGPDGDLLADAADGSSDPGLADLPAEDVQDAADAAQDVPDGDVPVVPGCEAAQDGTDCDDGNDLTLLDVCVKGKCTGMEPVICVSDAQCDDLYDCTDDACIGGECVRSAVICEPSKPVECEVAVCKHGKGCELKEYADSFLVVFEEDFQDGLAQGWQVAGTDFEYLAVDGPSGGKGLLVELPAGAAGTVSLPEIYLPPAILLLSIGFELSDAAACGDIVASASANGWEMGVIDACQFTSGDETQVGIGLPPEVQGISTVQLKLTNIGDTPLAVFVSIAHIEMQGGEWCCTDFDMDKVYDCIDNCPAQNNPLQEDCDGDHIGDLCDPDSDNDGAGDQYDAYDCDPGSQMLLRRVAQRNIEPLDPTAIACATQLGYCFVFDSFGTHVALDLGGKPEFILSLPDVQLARAATYCAGVLWVLDAGPQVFGFDMDEPWAPKLKITVPVPPELTSLNQAVACLEGDLVITSTQYLHTLEQGGVADLFFDVNEEIWALDLQDDYVVALTRSPQPPLRFWMRVYTYDDDKTIMPMIQKADELSPTVLYQDMAFAGWGGDGPGGGLWIVLSGDTGPELQLFDPWRGHFGAADLDQDGLDDADDPDDDDDGVSDAEDYAPLDPYTQCDEDSDGLGSYEDPDDDNDGLSDNFGGLTPAAVSDVAFVPGVAASGVESSGGKLLLTTKDGNLLTVNPATGAVESTEDLPLNAPDGVAVSGNSRWIHDSAWKGILRMDGGKPRQWLDSPEVALFATSLRTDLAAELPALWVASAAGQRVYLMNEAGSVELSMKMPAEPRGVAAGGAGTVFVLLAVADDECALLHLDAGGRLLGYFKLYVGGLVGLTDMGGGKFATIMEKPAGTSILSISLPQGFESMESPPEPPIAKNHAAVLAPFVPTETGADWVKVSWPKCPAEVTTLQVCKACVNLTGFIPPQSCTAVETFEDSHAVTGLTEGQPCAFELRITSPFVTGQASRRVSITVGAPASGSAVFTKTGGLSSKTFVVDTLPGLLTL